MNELDVSVVIPTFHRETQLLEAIGSVLGQSGVTLQVIVVDDSGKGTARDTVASLGDGRVLYIARPEPSGGRPALVRNEGAGIARGRYLHFLDDDDMLEPDALSALVSALDAAGAAGMAFGVVEPFGTDATVLRSERRYFSKTRRIAQRLRGPRELSARLVFLSSMIVNSACMVRRTAFLSSGGYDVNIPICEDAEFWGRIVHATGFVFVDRPVVRYRTGAPSLMHNLVEHDENLNISYRRIHRRYRQAHGILNFLAMMFWTRVILEPSDTSHVNGHGQTHETVS